MHGTTSPNFTVDTVVCAPDDGWWYHPKPVEQFPDVNKLCKAASCWINIGAVVKFTGLWHGMCLHTFSKQRADCKINNQPVYRI
jgi:hypothetical protein